MQNTEQATAEPQAKQKARSVFCHTKSPVDLTFKQSKNVNSSGMLLATIPMIETPFILVLNDKINIIIL